MAKKSLTVMRATVVKVEREPNPVVREYVLVTVKYWSDLEATFRVPMHRADAYKIGRTVEVTLALSR